jgi:hypothetical protein
MVSEVLSDRYSIEKLYIFGSKISFPGTEYLNALMSTNHQLKALKFGKNLNPKTDAISLILEKFKPSLTSLSLCFQDEFYDDWDGLLSAFLTENSQLTDLEVILENSTHDFFRHSYLAQTINLKSFSFEGKKPSDAQMRPLFAFFASHASLQSLNLKFVSAGDSYPAFIEFYEKFVAAIYQNLNIERVVLTINVGFKNCSACVQLFSEKTRPLAGRNLTLNSVPVDSIISDLAYGLEEGLFWRT